MPEIGALLLRTRGLNKLLGTAYTIEQVQDMDWLIFESLAALQSGLPGLGG